MSINQTISLIGVVLAVIMAIITVAKQTDEEKTRVKKTFTGLFAKLKHFALNFVKNFFKVLLWNKVVIIYLICWEIWLDEIMLAFSPAQTRIMLLGSSSVLFAMYFERMLLLDRVERHQKALIAAADMIDKLTSKK